MTKAKTPLRGPVLQFNVGPLWGAAAQTIANRGAGQVTMAYSFANDRDFTISLWAKALRITDGLKHMLIGGPEEDKQPSLYLKKGTLFLSCWVPRGTGHTHYVRRAPVNWELGVWKHVTWVKRGPRFEIYLDGGVRMTTPFPERFSVLPATYRIGHGEGMWVGQITDVRIFSIARQAEDIARDFNRRLSPDQPGLSAYWPCDDGTGTEVKDHCPGGLHGTMQGVVDWVTTTLPFAVENPAPAPAPTPTGEGTGQGEEQGVVESGGESGGLAYWLRWRQRQRQNEKPKSNDDESFRRGAIWR